MATNDEASGESVNSHRRRFLRGVGAAGIAGALAGCLGDDGDDGNGDDGNGENGDGNGQGDDNGGNGNGNGDNGDPEPAFFAASELDPEETTVARGETADVSATVENTGEEEGTQDVALTVDGDEVESTELTLGGGESTGVSFELDTADLAAGDYEHAVATEDEEVSGTVTVEPLLGDEPDPLLSFDADPLSLVTGTNAVEGTLENPYPVAVEDGDVSLEVPDGWEVTGEDGTSFDELQGSQDVAWELSVPDDAAAEAELTADVTYSALDEEADASVTVGATVVVPLGAPWGLNNGNEDETYGPVEIDGLAFENEVPEDVTVLGDINSAVREEREVEGTDHDELYLTEHWGSDLGFEIPVENGAYNVTLHFAETYWGEDGEAGEGGEGSRLFDVYLNGDPALEEFDPYARAGGAFVAVPRTFPVEVTDGFLAIETETQEDNTVFKGIEIRESDTVPVPYGYNASGTEGPVVEVDGVVFDPDPDFVEIVGDRDGGSFEAEIDGTDHDALYYSEDWGNEASDLEYRFPVENGEYEVTLHFAETFHEEEDARVMDVYVGDELFLEEYDILAEVGFMAADARTTTTEVTDGILSVALESVVDWPKICGIEIRPA